LRDTDLFEEIFECFGATAFVVLVEAVAGADGSSGCREFSVEFIEWNMQNEPSPPIRFRGIPGTVKLPATFRLNACNKLTVRLVPTIPSISASSGDPHRVSGPRLQVVAHVGSTSLGLCWAEEARLSTFLALGECFRESLDAVNPLTASPAASVGAVDRLLERYPTPTVNADGTASSFRRTPVMWHGRASPRERSGSLKRHVDVVSETVQQRLLGIIGDTNRPSAQPVPIVVMEDTGDATGGSSRGPPPPPPPWKSSPSHAPDNNFQEQMRVRTK